MLSYPLACTVHLSGLDTIMLVKFDSRRPFPVADYYSAYTTRFVVRCVYLIVTQDARLADYCIDTSNLSPPYCLFRSSNGDAPDVES